MSRSAVTLVEYLVVIITRQQCVCVCVRDASNFLYCYYYPYVGRRLVDCYVSFHANTVTSPLCGSVRYYDDLYDDDYYDVKFISTASRVGSVSLCLPACLLAPRAPRGRVFTNTPHSSSKGIWCHVIDSGRSRPCCCIVRVSGVNMSEEEV